ncbi:helix-turn-helix domain-containing protein [Nocardia terpenica]|uniref:helix-turn-helix domain-containing protein n=1 Tax=Nocardia terpenica TaxID=455432 RepID=UPI0018958C39|nr:helix-turn-helix transcriptional regulator [Nocardia terpenica]MBF6061482.1 helix-turn-helix domain-containing protein [Nocardia terpenica]MBF6105289.1 helix-turn-helix domain-containing protein [Nocardia terpenica]MBF6113241.1 helix-turn-helix domain-containing protein [Nocardia terpenica]MBF6119371.1 helix-turn-helix domain-containing protein [Nocardia terpenica]MBF6153019.1 helix-turn-helix domain-containing protein [Nocardia terpenica]
MVDEDPDEVGSTLPRRQLGRYLREARQTAGMTLEQAADLMEWGKTTLQNLETSKTNKVRGREVRELCEIYGVDEAKTDALVALAKGVPAKTWYHTYGDVIPITFNLYIGLEAGAQELAIYQPILVPGLLQTEEYARALDRLYFSNESDEQIERRVQLRIKRQNLITRRRKPVKLRVVVQESALRTVIGSPQVMSALLRHLVDMSTRENVDLRVLPFGAGCPCGVVLPPFVILDFGLDRRGNIVEPTIVFSESLTGATYFERRAEVEAYRGAFETVHAASLAPLASRDKLRDIAREFDRGR